MRRDWFDKLTDLANPKWLVLILAIFFVIDLIIIWRLLCGAL